MNPYQQDPAASPRRPASSGARRDLDCLRFEVVRSVVEREGRRYANLKLLYYVLDRGRKHLLVRIDLTDTQPIEPNGRNRFWFHYQPVLQHLPPARDIDGEPIQRAGAIKPPLVRDYPSIDLIVYSSVTVRVFRFLDEMRVYQQIGFAGVSTDADRADATLSPTRPKISLRRVHRMAQIPLQGSPSEIQLDFPDFSFYVGADEQPSFTTRSTLAGLIRHGEISGADAIRRAARTWTRIFFDQEFTEFNFIESSYRLRVFDQGYDRIDGMNRINDEVADEDENTLTLEDARNRYDTAEELISYPKYFDYRLEFDKTEQMFDTHGDGRSGRRPYRTTLRITRSGPVALVGTIDRDAHHDARTNAMLAKVPRPPSQSAVITDYRDYLPAIGFVVAGERIDGLGELEQSHPENNYLFQKSAYRRALEFQLSLALGFTPIIGEAFGLYELYTALSRGEDAFGNKLTDNEKILVAIAAILPLVNLKMLQSAKGGLIELRETIETAFPTLGRSFEEQQAALRRLARA